MISLWKITGGFHFKVKGISSELKVKLLSKYLRGFTYDIKVKGFLLYNVEGNGDIDG